MVCYGERWWKQRNKTSVVQAPFDQSAAAHYHQTVHVTEGSDTAQVNDKGKIGISEVPRLQYTPVTMSSRTQCPNFPLEAGLVSDIYEFLFLGLATTNRVPKVGNADQL